MSQEQFHSFRDIVAEVLSNRKKDPLLHLLVLTYEFDDKQLRNLCSGQQLDEDFDIRRQDLKILSDLRPIVIYDARKTKESNALPQFLELHPLQTKAFSCHHSKAYFLVTRKTIRLVIGSFNLTVTGLFRNREVYQDFQWDSEASPDSAILSQWMDFIAANYQDRLRESSQSSLLALVRTVRERKAGWNPKVHDPDKHILHSGYTDGETGLALLRTHWDTWFPGKEPDTLFAVSPFFDENPANGSLARDLLLAFPDLKSRTWVTDESVVAKLSKRHFASVETETGCALFAIPAQLSDKEKKRIHLAANMNEKTAKDLIFQRKLHAKILILRSGNAALAYMGSANFSRKAWKGDNLELGLVWKDANPAALEQNILRSLGAAEGNRFPDLPTDAPPLLETEDEEGYKEDSDFPGFLELILLEPSDGNDSVRFVVETRNADMEPTQRTLSDYNVDWGGIALLVDPEGKSQWIDMKAFRQRIPGYRNLTFRIKSNPERIYYFPFQYTGNLISDRETFILPTSLDWMAFYLNPEGGSLGTGLERLPGEEEGGDIRFRDLLKVDRQGNCVIAMQSYLNLFGEIEADFTTRIQTLAKIDPLHQKDALVRDFIEPLRSYGRILEQEAKAADGAIPPSEHLFKMGEFLALVTNLHSEIPQPQRPLIQPLVDHAKACLTLWKGSESLRSKYVSFALAGVHHE